MDVVYLFFNYFVVLIYTFRPSYSPNFLINLTNLLPLLQRLLQNMGNVGRACKVFCLRNLARLVTLAGATTVLIRLKAKLTVDEAVFQQWT